VPTTRAGCFTRAAKRLKVSPSALSYKWELDKDGRSVAVAVNGPLIVDDVEIMIRAAIDGVGLAFMSDDRAAPHVASGELVGVLDDWSPPFPGFFLYYPSRRQQPAALSALIETLRLWRRDRRCESKKRVGNRDYRCLA
jgi:DNA-binding transcriptional LysR family regulator